MGVNTITIIKQEFWPPSSPDLNPMDFSIWSILEKKACASSHSNAKALKRSLEKEWEKILQSTICAAVESLEQTGKNYQG